MSELYNLQKGNKFKFGEKAFRVYELIFAGKEECRVRDVITEKIFIYNSHSIVNRVNEKT